MHRCLEIWIGTGGMKQLTWETVKYYFILLSFCLWKAPETCFLHFQTLWWAGWDGWLGYHRSWVLEEHLRWYVIAHILMLIVLHPINSFWMRNSQADHSFQLLFYLYLILYFDCKIASCWHHRLYVDTIIPLFLQVFKPFTIYSPCMLLNQPKLFTICGPF